MESPTFDWRDFDPLAIAETTKFYRKQKRGRFVYAELLSEARLALATSKGAEHARESIQFALLDFARDGHKLVKDVEISPDDWQRTRGGSPEPEPPPLPAAPLREYFENDVKVTVWPKGLRLAEAPRQAGDGKATSKHGKVPAPIKDTRYDDGRSQKTGQVRAKIDGDALSTTWPAIPEDQRRAEAKEAKRQLGRKPFSGACLNRGVQHEDGAKLPKTKKEVELFGVLSLQRFRDNAPLPRDDRVKVRNKNPPTPSTVRRTAGPKTLATTGGHMTKFGLEPVPGKRGKWIEQMVIAEGPRAGPVPWHTEAPRFRDISWHLPGDWRLPYEEYLQAAVVDHRLPWVLVFDERAELEAQERKWFWSRQPKSLFRVFRGG